jgi:hypothetical protein
VPEIFPSPQAQRNDAAWLPKFSITAGRAPCRAHPLRRPSTHCRQIRPASKSWPAMPCSTLAASRSPPAACSADGGRIHRVLRSSTASPRRVRWSRLPASRPMEPPRRLPAFCLATHTTALGKFFYWLINL